MGPIVEFLWYVNTHSFYSGLHYTRIGYNTCTPHFRRSKKTLKTGNKTRSPGWVFEPLIWKSQSTREGWLLGNRVKYLLKFLLVIHCDTGMLLDEPEVRETTLGQRIEVIPRRRRSEGKVTDQRDQEDSKRPNTGTMKINRNFYGRVNTFYGWSALSDRVNITDEYFSVWGKKYFRENETIMTVSYFVWRLVNLTGYDIRSEWHKG